MEIRYALGEAGKVKLRIYTITGELVWEKDEEDNAGANRMEWGVRNQRGEGVASGLYLYVVQAEGGNGIVRKTGKIVIFH